MLTIHGRACSAQHCLLRLASTPYVALLVQLGYVHDAAPPAPCGIAPPPPNCLARVVLAARSIPGRQVSTNIDRSEYCSKDDDAPNRPDTENGI